MKIVVVDDEALLVKGIRFNLQNEGYEVLTGSNGLEAVELARGPRGWTHDSGRDDAGNGRPHSLHQNPGVLSGPHHHADGKDGGYG